MSVNKKQHVHFKNNSLCAATTYINITKRNMINSNLIFITGHKSNVKVQGQPKSFSDHHNFKWIEGSDTNGQVRISSDKNFVRHIAICMKV